MDKLDILDQSSDFGKSYRDNSKRIKWARIFFIVGIPFQFIELVVLILTYSSLLSGDIYITQRYNLYFGILNILMFVVYVGTAWTFIQWLHRAYNNLHLIGLRGLSYSPKTAAWCWWIPLANLYIPYQLVNEIWLEGKDHLKKMKWPAMNSFGFTWIGPWWIFYVLSSLSSSFANFSTFFIYNLYDRNTAVMVLLVSSLTAIISLTCGLFMFARFSKLESALYHASRPSAYSLE